VSLSFLRGGAQHFHSVRKRADELEFRRYRWSAVSGPAKNQRDKSALVNFHDFERQIADHGAKHVFGKEMNASMYGKLALLP
jgi:hypothetical protein